MNKEKKKFFNIKRIFFISLFLFLFFNWLEFINSDKLACNDFYLYYFVSKKIFALDFNLYLIPPLFPLLLGLFGKILSLLGGSKDYYILGGQIISLISGFGVIYFTFKILSKFSIKLSYIGIVFLSISPFFLKLISTAQTDMLYLFFVSLIVYSLLNYNFSYKTGINSGVLGGLLTRFEGILLVSSLLLYYHKLVKKYWKQLIIALIPMLFLIIHLYASFAERLFEKINLIVSNEYYMFFFKNPHELVYLIYGNLFFFIPPYFPGYIKWILFYLLLLFFLFGLIQLFKRKWQLSVFVILYILFFAVFKGYTEKLNPDIDFRRWFSFLWLFMLIAIIGFSYFAKKIYGRIQKRNRAGSILSASVAILIVLFVFQLYPISKKKTEHYHKHDTNIGSYAIAKWLRMRPQKENILVYSHYHMTLYYLNGEKMRQRILFKDKNIYQNRKKLLSLFIETLKKKKVKFIAFDAYGSNREAPWLFALKKILFEERDKGQYFKVYKHLKYRGRYAASIVIPLYDKKKKNGHLSE